MKKLFILFTLIAFSFSINLNAEINEPKCIGGSCTFTKYRLDNSIEWTCSACAMEGQTPRCNENGCDTW